MFVPFYTISSNSLWAIPLVNMGYSYPATIRLIWTGAWRWVRWEYVEFTVLLSIQLSVQVAADYQLEVRLVSYSNPTHRRSNGAHCDGGNMHLCDNIFIFQLDVGNGWEQLMRTGIYWNNDDITFGDTLEGGLDNPLVFTGSGPWPDNVSLIAA